MAWLKPWDFCLVDVTVTLTADGRPPHVVHMERRFRPSATVGPLIRRDIDLRGWEGDLVLMEVDARVRPQSINPWVGGRVACSAEILDGRRKTPVEFVRWPTDPARHMHRAGLGVQCWRLTEGTGPPLSFAKRRPLWHVLRVPSDASLRLRLKPVIPQEAAIVPGPAPSRGLSAPVQPLPPCDVPPRPPDVFVYLVDALRADHLGCYGYDRYTSPAIDAFAEEATLYEDAHAVSTWTRPSVASVLTGLYPVEHGAMHESDMLAKWPVLLSEVLSEVGYRTGAIITNGNVGEAFGFNQGYDTFIMHNMGTAAWANVELDRILAREKPEQPVFVYVHTIEPHDPYAPSAQSFRRFDRGLEGSCDGSSDSLRAAGTVDPDLSEEDVGHLIDLYDGEILDADKHFAEFLTVLRRRHRLNGALIVFLSDHGESFAEHDTLRHGYNLNQEEMHVPLIIRFPTAGDRGRRIGERVSFIGLFPTILRQVGADPHLGYRLAGADLSPSQLRPSGRGHPRIFSEVSHDDNNAVDLVGMIDEDGYKRVLDLSVPPINMATAASLGLWDTLSDPAEQENLVDSMRVRAAYGEQLIAHWLLEMAQRRESLSCGPVPSAEMTDELRQQLRALGYLR
jgi:arylsulfatase A-like enzyme